jgi:single-stranded-DNA-specific exonuclease
MKTYSVRPSPPSPVQEALGEYSELMRSLLFGRGIETADAARIFLNPDYIGQLHDPFLMKDMGKAAERILAAVAANEKILIYSDYDADGIPGAVVLHDLFKKIGYANFSNYIPHRNNEGFGLNPEAIETFITDGVKLLITIDCGIADYKDIARAQEAGIDVILTDHHLPPDKLPPAFAVLNSKQADCPYPHKMLCGAAVAFKLAQAVLQRGNFDVKEGQEKWLLDMVGIATLSDMVPLTDENRVLAYYGLKVLQRSPRRGLVKLLSELNISQKYLTEDDIGFMVTPRINAASRMGVPLDAFRLLSTTDDAEAGTLVDHLENINNERKGIVAAMVKDMKKHLDEREIKAVIVMGNPDWKPSLLGLAANTLAETYNRPAFLWGRAGDGNLKGSARSNGTASVAALMEKARDRFTEFGGHEMSGGFSVSNENVHFLEDALVKAMESLKLDGPVDRPVIVDQKLSLNDVSASTWAEIARLAPFGMDNTKPLFLFEHVIPESVKQFGKSADHLELLFRNSRNAKVRAIGFFMKPEQFAIPPKQGMPVTLVATIEKSMFRNYPELRLRIVDII